MTVSKPEEPVPIATVTILMFQEGRQQRIEVRHDILNKVAVYDILKAAQDIFIRGALHKASEEQKILPASAMPPLQIH